MPNVRSSSYSAMDPHDYSDIEFYSSADHSKDKRPPQLDVSFGETSVHLPATTTSMEEAVCIDDIMSLVADQRVRRHDNYKENAQPSYRADVYSQSTTSFAPVRQPVMLHSKLHEALTQPTPAPNRLPQNPVKCGKCGEELSSRCLVQACSKKLLEETSCRRCGNELTTKCILSMCTPVTLQPALITHN